MLTGSGRARFGGLVMVNKSSEFLSMQVSGLAELQKALAELPKKLSTNIMRGALSAGANVIADEARRFVPVDTGQLKESIRVSSRLVRGHPIVTVKAGGRYKVYKGGKAQKGKPYRTVSNSGAIRYHAPYYAHFVEFGTVKMGARPFMRPAFDAKKAEAVEVIADYIRKRLRAAVANNG